LNGSGRNIGVFHARFYYFANSLKDYCEHNKLKIHKYGKLVVTKNEGELKWPDALLIRTKTNNVILKSLCEADAKETESGVKSFQRALFSPSTSMVDPLEVTRSLAQDERIEINIGTTYQRRSGNGIGPALKVTRQDTL
jgi:(S)-2-hydroxyglutarate dehydrogenase